MQYTYTNFMRFSSAPVVKRQKYLNVTLHHWNMKRCLWRKIKARIFFSSCIGKKCWCSILKYQWGRRNREEGQRADPLPPDFSRNLLQYTYALDYSKRTNLSPLWITTGKSMRKLLCLHQLTQNMTLNYQFSTYMKIPSSEHSQNTCFVHKLFFCFCFDIQNNLCTQHVLTVF